MAIVEVPAIGALLAGVPEARPLEGHAPGVVSEPADLVDLGAREHRREREGGEFGALELDRPGGWPRAPAQASARRSERPDGRDSTGTRAGASSAGGARRAAAWLEPAAALLDPARGPEAAMVLGTSS